MIMGLTQTHKAAAGAAYITEIKRRILVREVKKDALEARAADDKSEENETEAINLRKLAKRWAKRIGIAQGVAATATAWRDSPYRNNRHHVGIWVEAGPACFFIPESLDPEIIKDTKRIKANTALREELCTELEFLHKKLAPSAVASFQAHASRLIAKADDATIDRQAVALIDDFLAGTRTYLCKVA
jgi:hypothetical protein